MTSTSESGSVQVGILGVGAITQIVHLPILSERLDVDLVAVSDPDHLKAETLGARFGVTRVLSNEEILSDDQIQADKYYLVCLFQVCLYRTSNAAPDISEFQWA